MTRLAARYALPVSPDDQFATFDRPVLIVTGRQDAVVGFEDQWSLARRLPRATYAMLERAGHNIQVDQPAIVRDLLSRWAAAVMEQL